MDSNLSLELGTAQCPLPTPWGAPCILGQPLEIQAPDAVSLSLSFPYLNTFASSDHETRTPEGPGEDVLLRH